LRAEQIIDPVALAPGHQGLAGKAGIGAQQNAHARPLAADLRHDARNFLNRPGRPIDV
jgi:hypothetical protein